MGLNGLLVLVILSVFIAGLMVGRTPEYLGKKIQAAEIKLVAIYILVMPASCCSASSPDPRSSDSVSNVTIFNPGPHGFTEMLYAFTSAAQQQRVGVRRHHREHAVDEHAPSAIAMLIGRFFLIIPTLALAGALVRKRRVPATAGTFPTHTPLFVVLVIGVTSIVAALDVPARRSRSVPSSSS